MKSQPTVRQINDHLSSMAGYCMVYSHGWQMRISRARTIRGVKEGRVINSVGREIHRDWHPIPDDATVELS
jgi:hypothetical protein